MAHDALALCGVDAYYGDSHVLHEVSLKLGEGRLLGLLGRNGAGKTSCLSTIVGLVPIRRGSITIFGRAIGGLSPEAVAWNGAALVPQGRRIFKSLTVRENLLVAARGQRKLVAATIKKIYAMFPRLAEREGQAAGHLSGGEQQMLAIGRALMPSPKVLLMDEPSEGLAPQVVVEVMTTIRRLKDEGLSILLVEQNPTLLLSVADDIVVLNNGHVVLAETTEQLKRNNFDFAHHLGVF